MNATARRKVLLHVGTPKTGTTAVQDILFRNRAALAAQGVLYPTDRFDAHFLAALDLMELPWGGLEKEAVGAWDRLAGQVREHPGTAIISHEILATASRPQVRRALTSFGDAELHIVVSARDLVRQIPAEWQENVKHRRVFTYREFLDNIADPRREGKLASWFWGVQEVPDILDRWGSSLPPERVHLVTVPPPGAPRGLLWERFASAFGIDLPAPAEGERSNPSLGVAETTLIRRINERVNDGVLENHHYREFVRETLAHRSLSGRTSSARLGVPPDVRRWAAQLSESWIPELGARGYHVVGSLDDLRPAPVPVTEFVDPDAPDEAEVADVAMQVIVTLLTKAAELREDQRALRDEVNHLRWERAQEWGPAGRVAYRVRQKLVHSSESSVVARKALGAYRKVRGNSSRSA